jgi:hypothetical protein
VECIFRYMENYHAPFFALFLVGPTAFLIEIWLNSRKEAAASKPTAPAAA